MAEPGRDEIWALAHSGALRCPLFEEVWPEARRPLDDHSSLLRSAHAVVCYGGDRALHDYCRPILDTVRKCSLAVALCPQAR